MLPTYKHLLAKEGRYLVQEFLWRAIALNGALICLAGDDNHMVYRVAIVLIPKHYARLLPLLGGVPL